MRAAGFLPHAPAGQEVEILTVKVAAIEIKANIQHLQGHIAASDPKSNLAAAKIVNFFFTLG